MGASNRACGSGSERNKVHYIVEQLKQSPSWMDVIRKDGDYALRDKITRIDFLVASFDTETIRKAIRLYMNGLHASDYLEGAAKIFVLLRVVFDVPGSVNAKDAKYFGGWANPSDYPDPRVTGRADLLWPFRVGKEGQLVLYGTAAMYNGGPYEPLQEFDFFNKQFGRRMIPSERGGLSGCPRHVQ